MDIDLGVIETMNAIWTTPYGIAAKWFFILGVAFSLVLMVARHKMTVVNAILALVGLKPVTNRDLWFNLLHLSLILVPLILLVFSMQVVGN